MKKLVLVLIAGLFLLTSLAHAQEAKQYTCSSIYTQIFAKKHSRELNYNYKFNRNQGDTSTNGFLTILLFTASAATGSLPIVLAATLTPTIISFIMNAPSKEERALRLRDETSKQFTRFVARMQNKVSANITAEEVEEVIQSGFNSGVYCDNLPDLANPRQIRKYAKDVLKTRYIQK